MEGHPSYQEMNFLNWNCLLVCVRNFNVKVKSDADITGDTEVIVRALKQPTCSKVEILDGGIISFDIEKELGVELVGETKFKIGVEEDEEPWDEIVDDITPEEDEALDKVDENYL